MASNLNSFKKVTKRRLDRYFKLPVVKKFDPIVKHLSGLGTGGTSQTNQMMMGRAGQTLQSMGFSPIIDRLQRYAEYAVMDYTSELQAGLDIFADDATTKFIDGDVIHINTEEGTIQEELESLYFGTLNINFNLWGWVRDMLKFGDQFSLLDLTLGEGITGILPLSVYETERVEDLMDTDNPIKFIINNQVDREFSVWEIAHFRMFGDRDFYPYGKSILESVRRYWRQLTMLEDSMLIYRIVRSPERRVIYVDVGGLPPESVEPHINEVANTLKNSPIDKDNSGNLDYRLNPMSMLDDYIIPVRGSQSATKIETLKGTTHLTDMQDIRYIQRKLVTSLKIPLRYLGLDDDKKSDLKNAAAQEDIRFSRTIERIQGMVVGELKKIGIIHLILKGYPDEVADAFEIQMKNPSSASEIEKLEVIKEKFGIAGEILEGKLADRQWVYENVLNFTAEEMELINKRLIKDYEFMSKLTAFSSVWVKKYTQEAEKEHNIEKPQDALAAGMGGGMGEEEVNPEEQDVAADFRAKSIGGDNNVGNKLLARGQGKSTILKPYESRDYKFQDVSDSNLRLLKESVKRKKNGQPPIIENAGELLRQLSYRNEQILEEVVKEFGDVENLDNE